MSGSRIDQLGICQNARVSSKVLRFLLLMLFAVALTSCAGSSGRSTNAVPPASSPTATPVAQDLPGQPAPAKKVFESGEAVPAGYLGYKVLGSWFKDEAAGKGATQPSTFIYVELAIVNTDKKERAVGPMKLIDEAGKEYSLSDKAPDKGVGVTKAGMVGSTQSKRATAVFEAPRNHEYQLKIQGFSATDEVKINLKPAATPPAK